MVKIILNREELSMVLGWIGSAQVNAEESKIPWDEFEQSILYKFKNAKFAFKEHRIRNLSNTEFCFVCDTKLQKTYVDGSSYFCPNKKCPRFLN